MELFPCLVFHNNPFIPLCSFNVHFTLTCTFTIAPESGPAWPLSSASYLVPSLMCIWFPFVVIRLDVQIVWARHGGIMTGKRTWWRTTSELRQERITHALCNSNSIRAAVDWRQRSTEQNRAVGEMWEKGIRSIETLCECEAEAVRQHQQILIIMWDEDQPMETVREIPIYFLSDSLCPPYFIFSGSRSCTLARHACALQRASRPQQILKTLLQILMLLISSLL